MNKKITIVVIISLVLASSIFYIIMDWYLINYDPFDKWVELQLKNQHTKKIFILGSSQVASLNMTHIKHYLLSNGENYDIYDLATAADTPLERSADLNKILLLKPDIVVYGIGFRDFERQNLDGLSVIGASQITTPKNILPDPHEIFTMQTLNLADNEFVSKILKDPEFVTLHIFNYIVTGNMGNTYPDISKDVPLIPSGETPTVSIIELKQDFERTSHSFNGIGPINKNDEALAFKKIITALKQNNVKVVIFTVPYSKFLLDTIPESDKQVFFNMLKDIGNEYHVNTYFLHDKYVDLNVWGDPTHVAYNKNTIIYTEDIEKIILNEIES